jgi:acyl-CoA synthetase (AMP-forming)/AMP-acid ligase II
VNTVTTWFQSIVAQYGAATALVEPEGQVVSFRALERRVAGLAGGLTSLGLERGDRLATFVPNGILPVELLLAAARLGAVTIGINTRHRVHDLRNVLERLRPRLFVATSEFLGIDVPALVYNALEGLDRPPQVLWPDGIAMLRRTRFPIVDDGAQPSDLVVAFATSGTTGIPKIAAHNQLATVRHLRAASRALEVTSGSTGLLLLPICGTFGFVSLFAILAAGGRVVVPDHFVADAAAALIEEYGVTHVNGSDDMLLKILDCEHDLRSWRHGVTAEFTGHGEEVVSRAEAVGARITGVYGSSETFAVLARGSPYDDVSTRARNGGILVDSDMEVRAVDPVSRTVLGAHQLGELEFRGPSVLKGYLTEDGVASPLLVSDGWYATGDLGTSDGERGFVYSTRLGDALRLAGFLTDPAEVEQCLLSHPAVTGAQVVGIAKIGGGEAAIAFVTGSGEVDEAALIAHCRRGLANYKIPERIVLLDTFPTVEGSNGTKVRKAELRQTAMDLFT